jgi:multiple sugar transport system substrate-binding protein
MNARWLPPTSRTLLSSVIVTSIAILAGSSPVQAKDHVDLQFWDMIWGPPEYIDAGKSIGGAV